MRETKQMGVFQQPAEEGAGGSRMKRTGIVKHERYIEHVMDRGHPESPERLRAIYQMLEESELKGKLIPVKPREATREELERIHSPEHIDLVASTAGQSHT